MAKAIELGLPKRRIEEAAARTQARIDSGEQTVIGVNALPPDVERALNVLKVDAGKVRALQIEKLKRLRAERDEAATQAALEALTNGARGNANLLQLSVEAARAKATVGEISLAMEKAFGRHVADREIHLRRLSRRLWPGAADANDRVIAMTRAFEENDGRRPRILVAKMGQDGHDRGQKIIASAFADLGFDVEIGPLFATPEEVADHAAKKQRAYRRRLVARRGPSRARAGAEARAAGSRPRRNDDRDRRRHPRAGFPAAARRRRRCDLPAGHRRRRRSDASARAAQPAAGLHPARSGLERPPIGAVAISRLVAAIAEMVAFRWITVATRRTSRARWRAFATASRNGAHQALPDRRRHCAATSWILANSGIRGTWMRLIGSSSSAIAYTKRCWRRAPHFLDVAREGLERMRANLATRRAGSSRARPLAGLSQGTRRPQRPRFIALTHAARRACAHETLPAPGRALRTERGRSINRMCRRLAGPLAGLGITKARARASRDGRGRSVLGRAIRTRSAARGMLAIRFVIARSAFRGCGLG